LKKILSFAFHLYAGRPGEQVFIFRCVGDYGGLRMFHPYAILNAAAFFNIEKTYFCPHIAESANIAESAQYRRISKFAPPCNGHIHLYVHFDGVSLCRHALVTATVVPISGKRLIKSPKLFLYSFEKGDGQKLGWVLNHWSLPVYREKPVKS
jgi:hypothetical protein